MLMSHLFALEVAYVPALGITNLFLREVYKIGKNKIEQKSSTLLTVAMGLDVIITDDSGFTFFFNNHISFLENSREYGNLDIINRTGGSTIEGVLYDSSWNLGYTFFMENFRIALGAGMGIFASNEDLRKSSLFAAGFVVNMNLDYFFVDSMALSLGIEDGIYGSINTRRRKYFPNMYNRFSTRIGYVIKF